MNMCVSTSGCRRRHVDRTTHLSYCRRLTRKPFSSDATSSDSVLSPITIMTFVKKHNKVQRQCHTHAHWQWLCYWHHHTRTTNFRCSIHAYLMIFIYRIYNTKFSRTTIFMDHKSSTAKLHPAKCLANVCMGTWWTMCNTVWEQQFAYSLDVSLLRTGFGKWWWQAQRSQGWHSRANVCLSLSQAIGQAPFPRPWSAKSWESHCLKIVPENLCYMIHLQSNS